MTFSKLLAAFTAAALLSTVSADSVCPTILNPSYDYPIVGEGWTAQLIASGLTSPRRLLFDSNGSLLVVEAGKGIARLTLTDHGGTCLVVADKTTIVSNTDLNHGLALSTTPSILLASTADVVYGYAYNAASGTVVGSPKTLVEGTGSSGESADLATRSILLSQKQTLTLVVARGIDSDSDDLAAIDESAGLGVVRVFDLSSLYTTTSTSSVIPDNPFEFSTASSSVSTILGWGIRHAAGLAEHPVTGGIFSTENSVANATYNGVDVHMTNPGDELNYHGTLNSSVSVSSPGGSNYGYPRCFAVANATSLTGSSLSIGDQFSMTQNSTLNDTTCAADYTPPTLTFGIHSSPQDLLFSSDGTTAYVALHGSDGIESGYAVGSIAFDNTTGLPTSASSSSSADFLTNILSNKNISKCPGNCFRPVGLAWDAAGRLYVSSDTTGEIYVLSRSSSSASTGTLVTTTASVASPTATATAAAGNAANSQFQHSTAVLGVAVASIAMALLIVV
ncbi:hypothetical protein Sste5346_005296 [Sporothrix stenoceras]|uniref:Pyrroloquinoline quinone-dependent pyranose dehydrogenase beta-propeller domain-containing protein n=1 Tax=Sporothrix stenoceras TaxID=5173 RepID=A0ABR3Z4K5_9PEZI